MELLTTTALQVFGAEGVTFASMGLSPLTHLDAPDAPPSGAPRLHALLARAFTDLRHPYDFATLARYKAKYAPDAWEHRLLCWSGPVTELLLRGALRMALARARRAARVTTNADAPG